MDYAVIKWRYNLKKGDKVGLIIKQYGVEKTLETVTGISRKCIYTTGGFRFRKDKGIIKDNSYYYGYRTISLVNLDNISEDEIEIINNEDKKKELLNKINQNFLEELTLEQLEKIYNKEI